jgi:hypothetical protein
MQKFYQIPTFDYLPISHEKAYLFADYEKISNFLAINFDKKTKDILAKPINSASTIDWYSNYGSLQPIEELTADQKDKALVKYWETIQNIRTKIAQLKSVKDRNSNNWADILEKIFDDKNNVVFTNGEDIAIVWGWQFSNNNNYRPTILNQSNAKEVIMFQAADASINEKSPPSPPLNDSTLASFSESKIEDNGTNEEIIKKRGFLDFLKWFASTYWWLLLMLLFFIFILLLVKLFLDYYNYFGINDSIGRIQNYLNRCCN